MSRLFIDIASVQYTIYTCLLKYSCLSVLKARIRSTIPKKLDKAMVVAYQIVRGLNRKLTRLFVEAWLKPHILNTEIIVL